MLVDDRDIKGTGFCKHSKTTGLVSVWLLVTMVDKDNINIGEKPIVFAFTSENAAKRAMIADIKEVVMEMGDVDFSEDRRYAQTKDRRYSWEIIETELQEE